MLRLTRHIIPIFTLFNLLTAQDLPPGGHSASTIDLPQHSPVFANQDIGKQEQSLLQDFNETVHQYWKQVKTLKNEVRKQRTAGVQDTEGKRNDADGKRDQEREKGPMKNDTDENQDSKSEKGPMKNETDGKQDSKNDKAHLKNDTDGNQDSQSEKGPIKNETNGTLDSKFDKAHLKNDTDAKQDSKTDKPHSKNNKAPSAETHPKNETLSKNNSSKGDLSAQNSPAKSNLSQSNVLAKESKAQQMSEFRVSQVRRIFRMFDKDWNNKITSSDLKGVINVKQHWDYISGKKTEQQLLKEYINNFVGQNNSDKDGVAQWVEFKQYFEELSKDIEADAAFQDMIEKLIDKFFQSPSKSADGGGRNRTGKSQSENSNNSSNLNNTGDQSNSNKSESSSNSNKSNNSSNSNKSESSSNSNKSESSSNSNKSESQPNSNLTNNSSNSNKSESSSNLNQSNNSSNSNKSESQPNSNLSNNSSYSNQSDGHSSPDSTNKDADEQADECYPGCKTCWRTLKGQPMCYQCKDGFYQKREQKYTKCFECEVEHCAHCDQNSCTKCKKGYMKMFGGCKYCYYDWLCQLYGYFEQQESKPNKTLASGGGGGQQRKQQQDNVTKPEEVKPESAEKNQSIVLLNPRRFYEYNRKTREIASLISRVSTACTKNPCNLNKYNYQRLLSFQHQFGSQQEWQYWNVYQYPNDPTNDASGYSINMTWSFGVHDNNRQKDYYTVQLVEKGSKPKLWFTGSESMDPILMLFETRGGIGNSSMAIYVYNNLTSMTLGQQSDYFFIPRKSNSFFELDFENQGSPSFEEVRWTGDIRTSKFVITFEYQQSDKITRIAKGIYRFWGLQGGQIKSSWKVYRLDHLNDIYKGNGYLDTFGSRHKFEYQDDSFYLVETAKRSTSTGYTESCILLADDNLVPLVELPWQLPYSYRGMTNFSAPSIHEVRNNGQSATLVISFQHRTPGNRTGDWNEVIRYGNVTSFVYFVEVQLEYQRDDKVIVLDQYWKTSRNDLNIKRVNKITNLLGRFMSAFQSG